MNRLILTFLLIWCSSLGIMAKRIVIDELSLPINIYMQEPDHKWVFLNPHGELVIRLVYWDTFRNSNDNHYSIEFMGYPDSSRSTLPTLFTYNLSGRSQNEVNKNSWGNTSYYEETSDNVKHWIAFSNGSWTTRIALHNSGHILLTYGQLKNDGSQNIIKSIGLVEGEETWNKLLKFLRKAHSYNIGKPK